MAGEVDPQTGYLIDLGILRDIIHEEVELRFDHKNLNLDTEEFKNLIPSAEHVCYVIWNLLRLRLDERYDLSIRLEPKTPSKSWSTRPDGRLRASSHKLQATSRMYWAMPESYSEMGLTI